MYNINWDDPWLFDITVNSAHMSVENSASALLHMVQLPEFKATPVLTQKMEDLLLESRCRLAIGNDERTHGAKVSVQSQKGNVTVTYLPSYGRQAELIPSVLESIKEIKSLICTVATTNILYMQERFNYEAESFNHLIQIAEKWNASVEIVRLANLHTRGDIETKEKEIPEKDECLIRENIELMEYNKEENDGGILDDSGETPENDGDDYGLPDTLNKLIQVGRAGAVQTVQGSMQSLANSLRTARNYSLVVVGDVFLSQGSAAQKRMKRDLISFLIDKVRVPVIGTEDLKEQYLFGPKQWIKIFLHAALCLLLYYSIFTFQEPILKFLTMGEMEFKILAVIAVTVFSPLAAYIISGFAQNLLKLIKLE